MKLLLDTHLLLWTAETSRLPPAASALIGDPSNEVHFSAINIWEVVIKNALGRPDFKVDPYLLRRGLLDNGYVELPVTSSHALAVATLPEHHRDPFDRLLVAQAMVEGMLLLTSDAAVARYPGPIQLVK